MSALWKSYQRVLGKYPLRTMALTTGTLMGAGDAIAQVCVEKCGTNYNVIRTVRFFGFGSVFAGPLFGIWYRFLASVFGATKFASVKMVLCDQIIFAPLFLTSFFAGMGTLRGDSPAQIKQSLQVHFKDVIITNWQVWPAVQALNFTFVPVQHRVLVVNFVALGWNTYLAWKSETVKETEAHKHTTS